MVRNERKWTTSAECEASKPSSPRLSRSLVMPVGMTFPIRRSVDENDDALRAQRPRSEVPESLQEFEEGLILAARSGRPALTASAAPSGSSISSTSERAIFARSRTRPATAAAVPTGDSRRVSSDVWSQSPVNIRKGYNVTGREGGQQRQTSQRVG